MASEPSTERYRFTVCKFCERSVRYDTITGRVIEIIGTEPHSPNCPKRQAHFKAKGYASAQARRDRAEEREQAKRDRRR